MIAKISGKLVEKRDNCLIVENNNIQYEILVPTSVSQRIDDFKDADGKVTLIIYHYLQMGQGTSIPVLVGFLSEIEKDFFLQFITVSGIGPKAAVKALNKPISEVTRAIDSADMAYLKTLPGIGMQRAKDIIAKLQGKIGKFGLIKDEVGALNKEVSSDIKEEALEILLQLQYKRPEAMNMIAKAWENAKDLKTAEELLNEIYKQRVNI